MEVVIELETPKKKWNTFHCEPSSRVAGAGALRCRTEVRVARSGGDGLLVRQAAGCRATLPQTLNAASLNSSSTGHGALRHEDTNGGEEKSWDYATRGENLDTEMHKPPRDETKRFVLKETHERGEKRTEPTKNTNILACTRPPASCQDFSSLVETCGIADFTWSRIRPCAARSCP